MEVLLRPEKRGRGRGRAFKRETDKETITVTLGKGEKRRISWVVMKGDAKERQDRGLIKVGGAKKGTVGSLERKTSKENIE